MEEYSSKDLDHLGIVSVMCDEIDLVGTIDRLIPPDPRASMTIGECIKLMVINGLGFTSRPLYLESQFYASKPIERLLGRPLELMEISDDRLGRALDKCFEFGCDKLFSEVALKAALKFNVDRKFRHLDTTSMQVQGEYASDEENPLITFGYSKDHRFDLKQFMISLISSQDGDVPLLAQTIAGNTSDKKHFKETLIRLKSQIEKEAEPKYFVGDSALYVADTLKDVSGFLKWISRVPESVKAAFEFISAYTKEEMQEVCEGYRVGEIGSIYAGVAQRWLLVYSEQAFIKEKKTLERQIEKELQKIKKELKKLSSRNFDCECDAKQELEITQKKLKYHKIVDVKVSQKRVKTGRGRPKKDEPLLIKYQVEAELTSDHSKITEALKSKGKFIIATNELDEKALSNYDLLQNYKGQQSVERGFRFLKDPLFMTSSVFLKNEERIIALAMVMCLCLLVYSLAQRYLRQKLKEFDTTIKNQVGKPTNKPTMRWIFQTFEGVHLLIQHTLEGIKELILNLTPPRRHILQVLGPPFQKLYANAA